MVIMEGTVTIVGDTCLPLILLYLNSQQEIREILCRAMIVLYYNITCATVYIDTYGI